MGNPKEFELVILTGKPVDKLLSFEEAPVSIGRDTSADFSVDDPHASKTNCHIIWEDGQYHLVDNNSTNGTFLDEKSVKKAPLSNGNKIRIGETVLQFRCEEERAADMDKTLVLPQKDGSAEDQTVIDLTSREQAPPDSDATVIVIDEATVIRPGEAAKGDQATQIVPEGATQVQPVSAKKKGPSAPSPLARFSNLDRTMRIRILIAGMGVVLLAMLGVALLPSSPKPIPPPPGQEQNQTIDPGSEEGVIPSDSAAARSGEQIIQKAQKEFDLGKTRYEERFLKPGSLYDAIQHFEKTEDYLKDIIPKPVFYAEMHQLTLKAKETLQKQYDSLKWEAYRAIRTENYSKARGKLEAIVRLIPEPDDLRHQSAKQKLNEIKFK